MSGNTQNNPITDDLSRDERNSLRRSAMVLTAGFLLNMSLLAGVVWFGLSNMTQSQLVLSTVVETNLSKTNLFSEMKRISQERTITLLAMVALDDPFERDEQQMRFNELAGEFIKHRAVLIELSYDSNSRQVLRSAGGVINTANQIQRSVIEVLIDDDGSIDSKTLVAKAVRSQKLVHRALARLSDLELDAGFRQLSSARLDYTSAKIRLISISLFALLVGVFTHMFVARIIRHGERTILKQSKILRDKTDGLERAKYELEKRVAVRTQELAHSRDLAETTLHSIGDAVITTCSDGNITMMNPISENLTGWSFDEVQGKPLSEVFRVVNENSQEPVVSPVKRCLESGSTVLLETNRNLVCRNQSQVAIDDSAAPIFDQHQNIIGAILVFRDVTSERSLQRKLSYQATHDILTGLVNRHEFELRMTNALMFARNEQRRHAVAFLDLDQFKVVNDTCGHAAGDELLRQVTKLIGNPVRAHDTLARLGGDEFAILLEDCDISNAVIVCEKIRQDIKNFRFGWDDKSFVIGVSIGVVQVDQNSISVADVLSCADTACYSAKEAGRNQVCVFDVNDDSNDQRGEMQWVSKITEAIDTDRLVLYAQPIVPLADDGEAHSHCEVLVRMIDADGSIIPPGSFLPPAERYNLIQSIDRWVVQKTCELYCNKTFGDFLPQHQIISINLSGQSLGDKDILKFIKSCLNRFDIPPEVFCFEVTETAAISNMGQALAFIESLNEVGCSFALDDFGSGLSSFGYLQSIPVDYIKIDGRFVKDMLNNPIDAAMVKSINEIAHLMGKKTIAEFVETKEIGDKLRSMGIDYVQGWGYGKPVPLEEQRKIGVA